MIIKIKITRHYLTDLYNWNYTTKNSVHRDKHVNHCADHEDKYVNTALIYKKKSG